MASVGTYPGTVSPLRGLAPFSEAEREVFYGRERDVAELSDLVVSDGFRAGLLHGESGAGKTSLLRASLVPHLRDHGVIALLCDNIHAPIGSFVHQVAAATGLAIGEEEHPMVFLSRAVASSVAGQLFLFIIDDVEIALGNQDDHAVGEIGELFARVVTRSGGRGRFLFSCASTEVHRFGVLEHRTGSLFPPSSRFELRRFRPEDATVILERTWSMASIITEPELSVAIIDALSRQSGGQILPADLQIVALAVRELEIASVKELQRIGGAGQLHQTWITACARQTGDERAALRLLGELAHAPDGAPYVPEWAAAKTGTDPHFASHAFAVLQDKGLVAAVQADNGPGPHYALAHPLLVPRVADVAAPVRAASRRASELLGARADKQKRLTVRQFWALRSEGISPSTPKERALLERTRRFFLIVGAALLAIPVVVLLAIYISMWGHYYLDTVAAGAPGTDAVAADRAGDSGARVVVRAGRPGLSAFDWMPGPFGEVVADTGLSRPMVNDDAWARIANREVTGDIDDYGSATRAILRPAYRALVEYATSGDADALAALRAEATDPQATIALLDALAPIARGTPEEIDLVETSLRDRSPVVQRSALNVAAAAAKRRDDVYQPTLAQALTSSDGELRRLAFSAATDLGEARARELYRAALAKSPESDARRELLAAVATGDTTATPSAASAASILVNRDLPPGTREQARNKLRRSFSTDPQEAAVAAARLASNGSAPPEDRALALDLIRELAPQEAYAAIADDVKEALDSAEELIKGAALPLYARIDPKAAAGILATMFDQRDSTNEPLRVAMALGWGEVAKTKERAAAAALEILLSDKVPRVRAAAAEAYGNVGRSAQTQLIKMIKVERFDVAVGAAYGLANSAMVNASSSVAVGGIAKLWKKKGRQRQASVEVFARLARKKPGAAYSYLAAATNSRDEPRLHIIGVRGLCNGSAAAHRKSRRELARGVRNDSVEVRRVVIQCIVDHPGDARTAASIATTMARDVDSEIRTDAARVLANLVAGGNVRKPEINALLQLARDDEREVRIIAIRALSRLEGEAPEAAGKALLRAFDRADEGEKLALLQAAQRMDSGELITRAIGDESAVVRIAALDAALATGTEVAAIMSASLTDRDRQVRGAALGRLVESRDQLPQDAIDNSLRLAIRDSDPTLAQLALTTMARLGSGDAVAERLQQALGLRSEHRRMQAAAACIGLVERNPEKAVDLLTPLLGDPSHDVRVAMLPALASAWAVTHSPETLANMLRDAETHAMRRLTATAAFLVLARTDNGRTAAQQTLTSIAESGPPIVRSHAELASGLIESKTDGLKFLALLVP